MGAQKYGIDVTRVESYARQIKEIAEMGIQIGIVIGGGNIFRGLSGTNKGFDRVKGDSMGMLAGTRQRELPEQSTDSYTHGAHRRILLQSQSDRIP